MNHTTTTSTNCNTVWMTNVVYQQPVKAPEPPKYVPSVDKDVLSDLELSWWRIHGYRRDPGMGIDKQHEKKGWFGLTVTNMSDHEWMVLKAWHHTKDPKKEVYLSKRDYDCGNEMWVVHFIGNYDDYCVNFWFATEELMFELIAKLKAFPKRKYAIVTKNPKAAAQFYRSTNFKLIQGSDKWALGLTDECADDLTLIRIAAT